MLFTFVSCEEVDYYRIVVSAGQLCATAARTNHIFAVFFFFFLSLGTFEGLGETKLTLPLRASH